jgi:hypothetical protein
MVYRQTPQGDPRIRENSEELRLDFRKDFDFDDNCGTGKFPTNLELMLRMNTKMWLNT